MRTTAEILAAINADSGSGRPLAELLCVDCTSVLDVSGTAMALIDDAGHQAVVGACGPLAARLEELQFELGEGPSLDASRADRPVVDSDLSVGKTRRWPGFGRAALDAGVQAVLAFPLRLGAVTLGSLCLYRSTPGHLDGEETAIALAYADAGAVVLLHLQKQKMPGLALHPDLGDPLEYRAEVHQATGYLSVQASVGLAEALLLMRARAFASDRPLLQVARDVLAGRLRIQPGEDEDG